MATELSKRDYLKYDPTIDKLEEGEDQAVTTVLGVFDRVLHQNYGKFGHTYPTTHAKTLGVVKGKLIVPDDLPAHLKQGPFAKGGEYPIALRYSLNNHDIHASSIQSRGRGLAFKIFNWPGDRFPEGTGNTTHDMTMNSQYTVSELADAKTAAERIALFERMLTDMKGGIAEMKARPDAELQLRPIMPGPRYKVESMEFYSQYAYRFGNYMAKSGIVASSDLQKAIRKQELPPTEGLIPDVIESLKKYYAENDAEYEWKFQLCENLDDQPIGYAGKIWPEDKYPYQTVAKLVIPRQNSYDEELVSFWEDSMRINIWRGLSSMQPLGGACRVRRVIYPSSKVIRAGLNPSKVIDVQNIHELPGELPEAVSAIAGEFTGPQPVADMGKCSIV